MKEVFVAYNDPQPFQCLVPFRFFLAHNDDIKGLQDQIEKEIKELGKKPLKEPPDWPPPSGIPQPVKWVLAPGLVKVQPGD
ncbi:hypothetical protein J6590_060339 [Homalodisca vitripennis]|nr:hypothetical protein J6590_060339 [Homalodisca vitripennis]